MSAAKNEIGNRYGLLTVISEAAPSKTRTEKRWLCQCECGGMVEVYGGNLRSGKHKSCGCLLKERRKNFGKLNFNGGHCKDRIHHVWMSMKQRCLNPNNQKYKHYGGRGIRICDEWLNDFEAFRNWAYESGYQDKAKYGQCTLDRIDVNGNYEPNNCRWTDLYMQAKNKRKNNTKEE